MVLGALGAVAVVAALALGQGDVAEPALAHQAAVVLGGLGDADLEDFLQGDVGLAAPDGLGLVPATDAGDKGVPLPLGTRLALIDLPEVPVDVAGMRGGGVGGGPVAGTTGHLRAQLAKARATGA